MKRWPTELHQTWFKSTNVCPGRLAEIFHLTKKTAHVLLKNQSMVQIFEQNSERKKERKKYKEKGQTWNLSLYKKTIILLQQSFPNAWDSLYSHSNIKIKCLRDQRTCVLSVLKPKPTYISQQRTSNDLEYHMDELVRDFQQLVSQKMNLTQSNREFRSVSKGSFNNWSSFSSKLIKSPSSLLILNGESKLETTFFLDGGTWVWLGEPHTRTLTLD